MTPRENFEASHSQSMSTMVALRKTSLIDFPGRVAAVIFVRGCNFRCPYCHNAALVDPAAGNEGLLPLAEALKVLEKRSGLLSGLVLSGGEPLLFEYTAEIAKTAKALGLAVKIDTNGYFPERLESLGADYIAIDLKTDPARYARVAPGLPEAGGRVVETLRRVRRLGTPYEIRITCAPGVIEAGDLPGIAEVLEPDDMVYLQRFRGGGCLDPEWDSKAAYPEQIMRDILSLLRKKAPLCRIRGLA